MAHSVTVLDSERRFLEYVHPAVARRLLNEKNASVWTHNPFAIKLNTGVDRTSLHRSTTMPQQNVNFTQYFKEERDVYVQNVAKAQVSVMFDTGNGVESHLFSPTNDPIVLTQHFPFQTIKNSMDFRKMLGRRPAALQLLTEEEFNAYYAAKAAQMNMFKPGPATKGKAAGPKVPDTERAINEAADRHARTLRKEPLPNSPKPVKLEAPEEAATVLTEDIINPRVMHLCNQVKAELTDQEKMPANLFLQELKDLEDVLTMDDYQYVQSRASYKSVRNYVKTRIAALAESMPEVDE